MTASQEDGTSGMLGVCVCKEEGRRLDCKDRDSHWSKRKLEEKTLNGALTYMQNRKSGVCVRVFEKGK